MPIKRNSKGILFWMSALGVRYRLSEAAVFRYGRARLQHRELQNSIAAIHFFSSLRDEPILTMRTEVVLPRGSNF